MSNIRVTLGGTTDPNEPARASEPHYYDGQPREHPVEVTTTYLGPVQPDPRDDEIARLKMEKLLLAKLSQYQSLLYTESTASIASRLTGINRDNMSIAQDLRDRTLAEEGGSNG